MKRILFFIAFAAFFIYNLFSTVNAEAIPISLLVNGQAIKTDSPPVIQNSRALVPVRAIFERLGAKVTWDGVNNTVMVVYNNNKVTLKINDTRAYINNKGVNLEVKPQIINSRTMIPLRFVAEGIGCMVEWNSTTRTVYIKEPAKPSPSPTPKPSVAPIAKADSSLESVRAYNISGGVMLVIKAKAPIAGYKSYDLTAPNRMVLEIPKMNKGSLLPAVSTLIPALPTVRLGDHDGFVRIVCDLENKLNYKAELSGDKTKVTVTFLTGTNSTAVSKLSDKAKGLLVVLDPGHGGTDPGAIGKDGDKDIYESDIDLDIALKLEAKLKAAGARVALTRNADEAVELMDRPEIANDLGAAIFISIHNNSIGNPEISGSMVFYSTDKDSKLSTGITSQQLADYLLKGIVEKTGLEDLGVREGDDYIVIKYTKMPSVIVELAFLTNPDDLALLQNDAFRQTAAEGLCNGIINALNSIK